MKKRLLSITLSICSLVCFAIAGIGVAFNRGGYDVAQAYEIVLDEGFELQTEYAYGETFTVPSAKIENVSANKFVVVSPTGAMYSTPTVSLTESGQYTVIWYATVNGKEVAAEKNFMVTKSAFTVTNGAKWGYLEDLERVSDDTTSGIKVTLVAESSFSYNRAIDLSDPNVPVAKIYPYQGILNLENAVDKIEPYQYNIEARNILVTLTDCYDPTNYVTIDLEWAANKDANRNYWNFRAGAVGQTAHGLRETVKEGYASCMVDDKEYTYMLAPGQGTTACNVTDDYGLTLYYDVELNRVYISHYRYASGQYTSYNKRLIADLANETIYPKNPFKGFKGTEVYLSISASNFILNSANLEIASLGGLEGGEMLSASMNDEKAPIIELPEALKKGGISIARYEQIEIPDALVYDISIPYGTTATKTVYYGYNPNSSNNVLQPLSNGKFTPNKTGVYTVIYSATDASGNVGTARVDLQCQNVANNKAVTLDVQSQVNASAGSYLDVPVCSVSGFYSDASAVKKYVQFEDEDKYLFTGDTFFLRGVGNYVITYEYDTPLKTYTATCTVTAAASDTITIDAPALPEYFIKGATYTLDTAYAYEYNGRTPTAYVATVSMSSDGGEYVEINSDAVVITANDTVKFKYQRGAETEYSDTIKVVDVGFGGELRMQKYFYSESTAVTSSASSQGLQYVTDGVAKEVTLKYVNTISFSWFAVEFMFLSGDGVKLPGSITFTLTDYYDRNNVVELSFVIGGGETRFFINGNQTASLEQSLLDVKTTLAYSEGGFRLGSKTYLYDKNFTSDRALLKIDIKGMTGVTCLNIRSLCDRKLTDATTDKAQPTISVDKIHTGYQPCNSVITITKATATDIVAPYVKSGLRLTVKNPDGTYAKSVDGVELNGTCSIDREYELKLDSIGFYTVLYEYTDQNGGTCAFAYSPIVRDEVVPVITVLGVKENEVVTAAWGATVKVASAIISDNASSVKDIRAYVSVMAPSGTFTTIQDGTFYAKEKGNYHVIYFCYDEVGNNTTFSYVVKVS